MPGLLPRGWRRLGADLRESLRGHSQDATRGPLGRALLLLAVPMVLELALESVFAVCDAWFVGRLGPEALATVGLTESMLTLVYGVGLGLAMATTAVVARRVGENRVREASSAAGTSILLGLMVSVVVVLPGLLFADEILRLMGADENVVRVGANYCRIQLGTSFVIVLLFLHNAIYRGAGDATMAMKSLWIANAFNIVLDPCLIFGLGPFPEMGLTGAAVATVVGRGIGIAFQLRGLFRGNGRLHLQRKDLAFDRVLMRRIFFLSLTGMLQFLVGTASHVVLIRMMNRFGDAATASWTLAIRILLFALLPAFGMANAGATMVGQNLGAKKPDRAERAVWAAAACNAAFMAVVSILMLAFATPLMEGFTDDTEVRRLGVRGLRTIAWGCVFFGVGMVTMQSFNGAGDTKTPLRANVFVFWLFQLPLAWILSETLDMGAQGIYVAVTLTYSLQAVVGVLLFRRGSWRRIDL
ncbi:MAG: MATE family efflux transporter [Planctomycetes bacterium]|nr:MATE family efflux transporter [Planctomycetota bacterium]